MTRSGEFHWISKYLAPLAGTGSFGLRDDAALIDVPAGKSVVVTQDAIASGIHFLPDTSLDLVARKAMRVNISDIVGKAALPHSYSLALGVPDDWQDADIASFASGLAEDQALYGIQLTGGDIYRSPDRLCIAVTMFALIDPARYKSRLGARAGDAIMVTGTIGDAALGLKVATGEIKADPTATDHLLNAYHLPDPPVATAIAGAIAQYASASMDISDGLIGDCRKLCAASNVGAILNRSKIPLSDAAAQRVSEDDGLWKSIYTGGDDYQVLCTMPASAKADFQNACASENVRATHVGDIKGAEFGSMALDIDGTPVSIEEDSFSHF
ncbi:MAG: thiamine-phosphate kinase [Rhizobiaceae bacterium]|nr:thiamine-phosphate kinase [Rhizobiaceae bacterium]